jgi:hypothetical protein
MKTERCQKRNAKISEKTSSGLISGFFDQAHENLPIAKSFVLYPLAPLPGRGSG